MYQVFPEHCTPVDCDSGYSYEGWVFFTVDITWWRFGAVGSDIGRINEVTLRRARLVQGWVTVLGFNSRYGKFISV